MSGHPVTDPQITASIRNGPLRPSAPLNSLVNSSAVVARPACTLSCTFDHRVLDGADVGRALTDLVEILGSAERLGGLPR